MPFGSISAMRKGFSAQMIVVHRQQCYSYSILKYKVFIDGMIAKFIHSGETVTFDLPNGIHTMWIERGNISSQKVTFDYTPGEDVLFEINTGISTKKSPFKLNNSNLQLENKGIIPKEDTIKKLSMNKINILVVNLCKTAVFLSALFLGIDFLKPYGIEYLPRWASMLYFVLFGLHILAVFLLRSIIANDDLKERKVPKNKLIKYRLVFVSYFVAILLGWAGLFSMFFTFSITLSISLCISLVVVAVAFLLSVITTLVKETID